MWATSASVWNPYGSRFTEKSAINDYTASGLTPLRLLPKLVGQVVSNWLRIAAEKRTLAFGCTKAHGEQLV